MLSAQESTPRARSPFWAGFRSASSTQAAPESRTPAVHRYGPQDPKATRGWRPSTVSSHVIPQTPTCPREGLPGAGCFPPRWSSAPRPRLPQLHPAAGGKALVPHSIPRLRLAPRLEDSSARSDGSGVRANAQSGFQGFYAGKAAGDLKEDVGSLSVKRVPGD